MFMSEQNKAFWEDGTDYDIFLLYQLRIFHQEYGLPGGDVDTAPCEVLF